MLNGNGENSAKCTKLCCSNNKMLLNTKLKCLSLADYNIGNLYLYASYTIKTQVCCVIQIQKLKGKLIMLVIVCRLPCHVWQKRVVRHIVSYLIGLPSHFIIWYLNLSQCYLESRVT